MSAIELSEASLVTLPRNCTAEIRVKTTAERNERPGQRERGPTPLQGKFNFPQFCIEIKR